MKPHRGWVPSACGEERAPTPCTGGAGSGWDSWLGYRFTFYVRARGVHGECAEEAEVLCVHHRTIVRSRCLCRAENVNAPASFGTFSSSADESVGVRGVSNRARVRHDESLDRNPDVDQRGKKRARTCIHFRLNLSPSLHSCDSGASRSLSSVYRDCGSSCHHRRRTSPSNIDQRIVQQLVSSPQASRTRSSMLCTV